MDGRGLNRDGQLTNQQLTHSSGQGCSAEYRPLSQLLLVTELDSSHERHSPIQNEEPLSDDKWGRVCVYGVGGGYRFWPMDLVLTDSISNLSHSSRTTILSHKIQKVNRNPSSSALACRNPPHPPNSTNACPTAAEVLAPTPKTAASQTQVCGTRLCSNRL